MAIYRVIRLFVIIMLLSMVFPMDALGKDDYTIVIDPGHGGKDAGALGRRTNEKTINLEVAKRLRDLIKSNMKDTKVVMTRDNDYFVTLQGRADIANRKHADLFISIHANSVDKKSPMVSKVNGASVYTLGLNRSETNLNVAMRENAVMKLEPDYSTTYEGFDPTSAESYIMFEMMQHSNQDQSIALAEAVQNQLVRTAGRKNNGVRQAAFWVLVRTGMPAILVELDFICNPTMEKFMASEQGQQKLALAIYRGIEKYRKSSGKSMKTNANEKISADSRPDELPVTTEAKPGMVIGDKEQNVGNEQTEVVATPAVTQTPTIKNDSQDKLVYKVQFMTASSKISAGDKRLKGLSPVESYSDGGLIKYTYGSFSSQAEAAKELKTVKKLFPDAFIIKMQGGKRIK